MTFNRDELKTFLIDFFYLHYSINYIKNKIHELFFLLKILIAT